MSEKITIYLIEDNNCNAAKALKKYRQDMDEHMKLWQEWAEQNLPQHTQIRYYFDGEIAGFAFPNDQPTGWKKPNVYGLSWPKKNSKILETMPKNRKIECPMRYLESFDIQIPVMIFEKDQNDNILASWGIGDFFEPVQFAWAGSEDNAPKCIITPNYDIELRKGAEKIRSGCVMDPPSDFDWHNLLSGCRVIPKYEWDYLCGKWQAEKQQAV